MFKYLYVPAVVILLSACNQATYNKVSLADSLHNADTIVKPITPNRQIIAGKSVGPVKLNADADSLIQVFGKPDSGDAAMGASLMAWNVKHNKTKGKLIVYAHRNMGNTDENIAHIKVIRVTLPWYKTADYSGPGSEIKDIQKFYKLKRHPANGKKMYLYDDYNAGIGFEVDSTGKCTAVLVHAPQDSSSTYLSLN